MAIVAIFIGIGCMVVILAATLTGDLPWFTPFVPVMVVAGITLLTWVPTFLGWVWGGVSRVVSSFNWWERIALTGAAICFLMAALAPHLA
jgi:hypothetical protein